MRKRDYLIFIVIFLSILGIYFLCISNIDLFITNYDHKIMSHKNNYKFENECDNIVGDLLYNSDITVSTIDDLEKIISSDYLLNILSYFFNLNEKEVKEFLKKSVDEKNINTLYSDIYDSEIIYIASDRQVIIFTMDGKNIYYNKYLDGETCEKTNVASVSENIENISNNTNKIMEDIGVKDTIGFKITSIRKAFDFEYNDLYSRVYFIFDKKNNIKITYNLDCNIIYILKVGFTELNGL